MRSFSLASALVLAFAASLPVAGGCSSSGRGGDVEVRLVDAPNPDVSHVVVTVSNAQVHLSQEGWVTVVSTPTTVDLLSLTNGMFKTLGTSALPRGHVTEILLFLSPAGPHYVVTTDGVQHPLELPANGMEGIHVAGGFDVDRCAAQVTLDFDARASIFVRPDGSGTYDLRPSIRLRDVQHDEACEENEDRDEGREGRVTARSCAAVACALGTFCDDGRCDALEE